jgi:hypothetical protein
LEAGMETNHALGTHNNSLPSHKTITKAS